MPISIENSLKLSDSLGGRTYDDPPYTEAEQALRVMAGVYRLLKNKCARLKEENTELKKNIS